MMKRKKTLSVLAIIVVAILCCGVWWHHEYWQVYHGYTPLMFSPEAWAAANAETRGHMVKDMLATHPLKGKSAEDVMALLGQPDGMGTDEETGHVRVMGYDVGYMGFNKKATMVFDYELKIVFDADGTVRETMILD
jgi:hypothetical protein